MDFHVVDSQTASRDENDLMTTLLFNEMHQPVLWLGKSLIELTGGARMGLSQAH